jgi:hypothetical protein
VQGSVLHSECGFRIWTTASAAAARHVQVRSMGAAFRMYLLHLDITQVECLFRVPVEQAASQAIATVLTSTEVMVCFSLPGAVRLCTGADWHGFAGGARVAAGAHDGDSFPRVDGGAQQLTVDRPDPGVAGQCREFDARGYAQHHREQLPRRDALPVPRADESAHRSPCEEHVRMTLKPSSFG